MLRMIWNRRETSARSGRSGRRGPADPAPRARRRALPECAAALCAAALLLTSAGCDEIVEVENLAPEVEPIGWCTAEARTFLVLRLVDREQDSVDLSLRAASCGGCEVETGGAGSGLQGLQSASGAPGALHRIEWRNAEGAAGELEFEVQATDAAGRRPAEEHVFPALDACPG